MKKPITVFFCALLSGISAAHAVDLNGAWANDSSVCNKIFVKKNNAISITKDSDSYGSGFIVDGNKITGKIAECTIKSRKQEGPLFHLIAACSTDVALQTVQFSFKLDSDNNLTRIFPGVPEMAVSYVRCQP